MATKLRKVKVEAAPLTLVWADPASLDENEKNWKVHTDFQSQVVGDLIERHGWIKPLVYNKLSGRLLDGHDRRKIAIANGMAAVPVVVGEWPEEDEAEILATLDPSGALARSDPAALDRVMAQFEPSSEALGKLVGQMAKAEGALEWLARNRPSTPAPGFAADPESEGSSTHTVSFEASNGQVTPSASHVRMVQIFLNQETFPEFRRIVDHLAEQFNTSNDSDTVMAALRDAYEAFQEQPA